MPGTADDSGRALAAQALRVGVDGAAEVADVGQLLDAVATRRRRLRLVGAAMAVVVGAGLGIRAVGEQSEPERLSLAAEDSPSTPARTSATTTTAALPPTHGAVGVEPPVTSHAPVPFTTARPAVTSPTTVSHPTRRCDGDEHIAEVAASPSGRLWATLGHDSLATSDDGGDSWTVRCDVFEVDGIGADAMGIVATSDRMAWAWLGTSAAQNFVRTTDGGASWHRVTLPAQDPSNVAGASFDGDSGWVWGSEFSDVIPPDSPCPTPHDRCSPYSSNPYLYGTSDSGQTWDKTLLPEGVRSISNAGSVPDGGGWIVDSWNADTANNMAYRTADNGRSWSQVALPATTNTVLDLSVWSGSIASVAVSGSDGYVKVATTNNGGATWATSPVLGSSSARVVMTDASTVAASAGSGQLWLSTDSGATWTNTRSGDPHIVSDLAANRHGHVVAADYGLLVSRDRGRSWERAAVT